MLLNGSLVSEEKSFLFGKPKRKEIVFAVQPLEQGCTVIVDIHKKRMEVYSLTPQNRETDKFVALFEEKAQAYLDRRICPSAMRPCRRTWLSVPSAGQNCNKKADCRSSQLFYVVTYSLDGAGYLAGT